MAIEVFNRHENKYLMNREKYLTFYNALLEYMEKDEYNKNEFYSISNLYFDTEHDTMIRTSLMKPKYKEKLRLRAYGVPNEDSKVYLEIKKKVNGLVNKRRTALKLNEAYEFVRTKEAPELKSYMNRQVVNEIDYILRMYGDLRPKLYLSYERKALFDKRSRDLRITFDTNIRCRRYDLKLELGDYGEQLLEEGQWLMEVKAEKTVPFWLSKLLSEHGLYRTSFSKYGNEYKKMLKNQQSTKETIAYA
ncbi:polyphosphate polymerase domain-containing protein [Cohnella thailandensis]|uniref:Polyphosphate polymerase domain-containing protein n=1 Tax=Cohnella thailandensis TaxID=557557 RepID=A0A841SV83_9BACL|nr:polyphosphate polymerase domain-containing protein [Cohnella thailandensis]MBB6633527.1 polyphosphate polymerase domain-containing protein [Cohnella thailandensis]MBP1974544.1 SPX domain protein involved in polyphosphate accumulation [Cohnella thailandensis]